MNKLILAAAIASTMGFNSHGFAAGPIDGTIYGKVNVSVVNADNGTTDTWKLNSNASRLGVKGKTEIADGLYAVYKAEFEMCVDDGDCKGQTFTQRNIMGGIKGSFGTVWAGKHDSPTKLAQNKIDLFNDLEGDIKNTFEGENRVSNIVAYSSPKMNGFSTTVAMIPGEGTDIDGDGQDDTGLTDGISYSLSYSQGNLYIAVAGDQDVDNQDLMRIVAQYNIDALKLGVMYQQNEDNLGTKDESGFFVSAAYKLDKKTTLKAQYGSIEDDADGDEEQTMSLGADYKLAKGTKLYVFYTDHTDSSVGEADKEDTAFGLGMEHKF
ncbi:porin [SAR92 clade bacterium H921]|jgi:predicted porin|nr:porin [SAR92 clade bacterium H921]MDG0971079.1 porin [Porticoccaceae bacterium]MDG1306514.1 porin [Porticoccaceae bacterium]